MSVKAEEITRTYDFAMVSLGIEKIEKQLTCTDGRKGHYVLVDRPIKDSVTWKPKTVEIYKDRLGRTDYVAEWIPDNPRNNKDGSPGHFAFKQSNSMDEKYDTIGKYTTWWGDGSDYLGQTFKDTPDTTKYIKGDLKIDKKDFLTAEYIITAGSTLVKETFKLKGHRAVMIRPNGTEYDNLILIKTKPPLSAANWFKYVQQGKKPGNTSGPYSGRFYYCGYYENERFIYEGEIKIPDKIIAHYKYVDDSKPTPSKPGEIIFTPNECDWTNQGKTGEGSGAYSVNVKYTGDNPQKLKGSVVVNMTDSYYTAPTYDKKTGKIITNGSWSSPTSSTRTEDFEVRYKLKEIKVEGPVSSSTINGVNGNTAIIKEGENINLSGEGHWDKEEYTLPALKNSSSSTHRHTESMGAPIIPPALPNPTGQSGNYNIDWTKPKEDYVSAAGTPWTNKGKDSGGYLLNATMSDNLSGFAAEAEYKITDYSYYGHNTSGIAPYGEKEWYISETLQDGMYDFDTYLKDRATNEDNIHHGRYLIDLTDPTSSFTMGSNEFDGVVTIGDNLSGVISSNYYWEQDSSQATQHKWNPSTKTYEPVPRRVEGDINLATGEGQETSTTFPVRKPRGDRWILNVIVIDRAGNTIHDTYGVYNDPIKLKNFRIVDIKDPNWKHIFTKGDNTPTRREFNVKELPVDKNSNGSNPGQNIKRGYAYYFNINSEYADFIDDNIRIQPTFYYKQRDKRYKVDMYYPDNKGTYIKAGSPRDSMTIFWRMNEKALNTEYKTVGDIFNLTIDKDLREIISEDNQRWFAKYYIHALAVFVLPGHEVLPESIKNLESGEIIVNFEVINEHRSDELRFQYVPDTWGQEGGSKKGYETGDIIVHDGNIRRNALEDIKGNIIH